MCTIWSKFIFGGVRQHQVPAVSDCGISGCTMLFRHIVVLAQNDLGLLRSELPG